MANKILLISIVLVLLMAAVLVLTSKPLSEPAGNTVLDDNYQSTEDLIGGDKDEHGCLIAAGYQWCPSTEKCQRMWEEYCEEFKDQFRGEPADDIVCADYAPENCPEECVVCPPCPECSSISCQTEEFCAAMGIDRSWYESAVKQ